MKISWQGTIGLLTENRKPKTENYIYGFGNRFNL